MDHLDPLRGHFGIERSQLRKVAARSSEALNKAGFDWVEGNGEHDRDCIQRPYVAGTRRTYGRNASAGAMAVALVRSTIAGRSGVMSTLVSQSRMGPTCALSR